MSEPSTTRQSAPAADVMRPAPAANNHDQRASHPLAGLHQAIGNLGVLRRMPEPAIQPKLEIGAPDDEHEREADAVAAAVMRRGDDEEPVMSTSGATIRRAPEDEKKKPAAAPAPKDAAAKGKPPAGAGAQPKPPAAEKPKPKPADKPKPKLPVDQKAAEKKAADDTKKTDDAKKKTGAKQPDQKPKAEDKKPKEKPKPAATPTGAEHEQPKPGDKPPPGQQERKRDEPMIAAKAAPGAVPAVTPSATHAIQSAQGAGRPLAPADRGFYESRLGRDLGGVRIHDSSAAGQAARDIRAQAFTYGQDVFFGPGRYQPATSAGRELLAHELAHTIQQRPGAKLDRRVQRVPNPPAPAQPAPAAGTPMPGVTRDEPTKTITFPSLKVPAFRKAGTAAAQYNKPLTRPAGYSRAGLEAQRDIWIAGTRAGVAAKLPAFLTSVQAVPHGGKYYLKSGGVGANAPDRLYYGTTPGEVAGDLTTPEWDASGAGRGFRGFQVDHVLELQLGGTNTMDNLELLEKGVNGTSGNFIKKSIEDTMKDYVASLPDAEKSDPALELNAWRAKWNLKFMETVGTDCGKEPGPNDHWTADQIKGGEHLKNPPLREGDPKDLGSAAELAIATGAGGIVRTLRPATGPAGVTLFKPFVAQTATFHTDDENSPTLAEFTFALENPALEADAPPTVVAQRLPGARYAGTIDKGAALSMLRGVKAKKMSPIEVDTVEIGANGIYAEAQIITDLPIIAGSPIDLVIDGTTLRVSKTFDLGDFKLPAPMKVTQTSLTVSASTSGELAASGRVDAEIEKVGKGFLQADASTTGGFALAGGFDFTSDIFQPARVSFAYADGRYSGTGQIGIGPGKVPGVKGGQLTATYTGDRFDAGGHADFDIPGVESADVHLAYDAAAGLSITAEPKLKAMPGIRGGSLSVTVSQAAGAGGYKLKGHGIAQPDIPGVDAELTVDYDDGAFLAKVEVPFERGLIKGRLEAGATNRALDADGKPTGAAQGDVVIFGSGSATVQITPWLSGTAGIRLLPNGEVEVRGELTVPGVNLYDGKDYSRPLFDSPPIEFPIFGPVVLAISGGLRLHAGIGPGVLSGSIGIDYNPSHEDRTHLHGALHFHASAYAGIELYTRVGVGLSAVIGSVTGNVELGAEMRIEPAFDNDIQLDWTPARGVVIDVEIAAKLQPKLVFHLAAVLVARAGPFSKDWTKQLGQRQFGSGLDFGMRLPVHYEQGKPFDVDFSAVEFHTPEIDAVQTAKNFLRELTA